MSITIPNTLLAQIALSRLGYLPGPLDNDWGPKTKTAFDAWRRASAHPVPETTEAIMARLVTSGDLLMSKAPKLSVLSFTRIAKLSSAEKYAYPVDALTEGVNAAVALSGATGEAAAELIATMTHEADRFKTLKEYKGSSARYAPWYGRGYIQLTWEDNYRAATRFLNTAGWSQVDLVKDKERAAEPVIAALTAAFYWLNKNLNHWANGGNFAEVTYLVQGSRNPASNHIENRRIFLARARKELGL